MWLSREITIHVPLLRHLSCVPAYRSLGSFLEDSRRVLLSPFERDSKGDPLHLGTLSLKSERPGRVTWHRAGSLWGWLWWCWCWHSRAVLGLSLCTSCHSFPSCLQAPCVLTAKVSFDSKAHLPLADVLHQWLPHHIGGLLESSIPLTPCWSYWLTHRHPCTCLSLLPPNPYSRPEGSIQLRSEPRLQGCPVFSEESLKSP